VIVVLECTARPGVSAELCALFNSMLPDTRAFDGCESINAHLDLDDPQHVVLLERWQSRDHHRRYGAWRRERGDMDRIAELVENRRSYTLEGAPI
jgi:quinol monooxygenase YgiN